MKELIKLLEKIRLRNTKDRPTYAMCNEAIAMVEILKLSLPTDAELNELDRSIWAADPTEQDTVIKDLKKQINKATTKIRRVKGNNPKLTAAQEQYLQYIQTTYPTQWFGVMDVFPAIKRGRHALDRLETSGLLESRMHDDEKQWRLI